MKFQFISLFLLGLLITLRFLTLIPKYPDGSHLLITSKVYSEPIVFDREQYLKIKNLKVYLPKYPNITYGDTVTVEGWVSGDSLQNPKLIKVEDSKNSLFTFREKLIGFYRKSLPEPYASLVSGIVIGSKNMPERFWDNLKRTGTAHVVVASGTNVAMTISFLIGILTIFLKRRYAIWITLVGIFGYIAISGFDAPIVRAGIMGSVLLIGQELGKVTSTFRVLVFTCLLMLIIKPVWIVDLGFILSFVATISLMLMQKKIDLKLSIIPAAFREGLSTSIAAQIGVAPIIFVTFGQFNILSPIINALILWTIPYIMVVGAIGGIIGLVVPFLGRLILFVIYPLLYYFVKIIELF